MNKYNFGVNCAFKYIYILEQYFKVNIENPIATHFPHAELFVVFKGDEFVTAAENKDLYRLNNVFHSDK